MNREEQIDENSRFPVYYKESMVTPFAGTKLIPVLHTYTQLHQTRRHSTTNTDCFKEITLVCI